jgi:hypothetical protein
MDPDAIGWVLEESRRQWWNLRRWQHSGEAKAWVDARQGRWNHDDWLGLLAGLRESRFWPLDPMAVGEVLEELQVEWRNLRHWEESGLPRQWVDSRQGKWDREDWLRLLEELRCSEYWPLDPDATTIVLQRLTAEWWNFDRWRRTGQARLWVQNHQGQWDHDDWLDLVHVLRGSQFWPLNLDAVGEILEEAKRQYRNLDRWRQSGEATRWVAARGGHWTPAELPGLLESLSQSRYGPMDPAAIEGVLEECRNLHDWQKSDHARAWVDARQGKWNHDDWLGLLASLARSRFWPLDPVAVGEALRQLKQEWWNLRRWRSAGLACQWVQVRQGNWGAEDEADLLVSLAGSEFWPIDGVALGGVLAEVRDEWQQRVRPRQAPKEAA